MREHEERWKELCRQASIEKDSARLSSLVQQITELLNNRGKAKSLPNHKPENAKSNS